jgi:hypothetical protein
MGTKTPDLTRIKLKPQDAKWRLLKEVWNRQMLQVIKANNRSSAIFYKNRIIIYFR